MESLGNAYFIFAILLLILIVAWIVLPLAVIGTKPILRQILAEVKRTNALLDERLPALRIPSRKE